MRDEKSQIDRDTPQAAVWKGDFGRAYTDRNTLDPAALEDLYLKNYGIKRSELNDEFLGTLPKNAKILEVGCNTGNQLKMLHDAGWTDLSGVELQPYALEIARTRLPGVTFQMGSALALPYDDSAFELVFTSGVLIHISPADLPRAMSEIHRVSKQYIWGLEYYSPTVTEISYREHSKLLWKMDFASRYLASFPDLELLQRRHLPYIDGPNVDVAFLIRKRV